MHIYMSFAHLALFCFTLIHGAAVSKYLFAVLTKDITLSNAYLKLPSSILSPISQ